MGGSSCRESIWEPFLFRDTYWKSCTEERANGILLVHISSTVSAL